MSIPVSAELALIPDPPRLNVGSYIILDAHTGQIIAEQDAHKRYPIASLNKIMTAYIVADQAALGQLNSDDSVPISKYAQSMEGSRMFLRSGTRVPIDTLLKGLAIQSGNDAAVALAEHIGGDEDGFVGLMNTYAQSLQLADTEYATASGLPHAERQQYSSAYDQAHLVATLINRFPEHYADYRVKAYEYNGINQRNRNALLWLDKSVDGIKTGYTQAAGYCLAASAERKNMRLVTVLLGATTEGERTVLSRRLLEYGFRYYTTIEGLQAGEVVRDRQRVWGGVVDFTAIGVSRAVSVTIPRAWQDDLKRVVLLDRDLVAPVAQGDIVGRVEVRHEDEVVATAELQVLRGVQEVGIIGQWWSQLQRFFFHLFSSEA